MCNIFWGTPLLTSEERVDDLALRQVLWPQWNQATLFRVRRRRAPLPGADEKLEEALQRLIAIGGAMPIGSDLASGQYTGVIVPLLQ